ncbi:CaiB/BaiF CoA-transferase family protein [Sphingopyxis sp. 113P3]|uniref:CaiB/BaiF CoA-transferase family protein n=1 Tax=Sphingopyxis sp. (strain 113P3) TaxID=292913 RepID=UPI0006AD35E5|nr:CoA transferase [Sphingopyxis sp. 113P3]ALC10479.1 L-carnitine dehydratase/bile acid-inducible protein F [Sphingopyxis sp. 113P3]
MKRPLARFDVLDRSTSVAGRYCARLFAQLGAHVCRTAATDDRLLGYGGEAGIAFGKWLDAGKVRSAGSAPSSATVAIVDDGEPTPDDILRLEIGWFFPDGPYSHWLGNDPIVQALAGLAHGFGPAEGPPILARGHAPQIVAGTTAFIAALAGLIGRMRGASIDSAAVSIFEAACCFSEPNAVSYAHFGHMGSRLGINRFIPTYPCSIYPAANGWLGVTCLTPAQWGALADMIGKPELAHDGRFATTLDRLDHADAIDAILRPAFADRDAIEAAEEGQARRIPMAAVPDLADLPAIPHWRDRRSFDANGAPTLPFLLDWDAATSHLPAIGSNDPPLAGIRVVDFTMGWAGPLSTRTLADLGADVIKIESDARPDWWRGWERPEPGAAVEAAPVFSVVNRGKRGVVLDLKTPEGLVQAEALVRRADIVIDNFAPGILAKLGLDQHRLRQLRPGVVIVSMGAFGATGPWSGFRAYGSTVEQASGIPTINGAEDMPPALQHIAYGDPVAGLYAAVAALVGLAAREEKGGCTADLAQVETLFQVAADAIIARRVTGAALPRTASKRSTLAPCGCFAAAGDDQWVAVACHDEDTWHALCLFTGRADWILDHDLASPEGRSRRSDEIEAMLARVIAGHDPEAISAALQAAGIPAAPVHSIEALVEDPQLQQAGYWVALERSHLGRHVAGAAPFRFDGTRPYADRPAPLLGEHQDAILGGVSQSRTLA